MNIYEGSYNAMDENKIKKRKIIQALFYGTKKNVTTSSFQRK